MVLSGASQYALFPIRTSLTTAIKAIYTLGVFRWRQFCLVPASIRSQAQYATSQRCHSKFLGICLRTHETCFVQTGWQLQSVYSSSSHSFNVLLFILLLSQFFLCSLLFYATSFLSKFSQLLPFSFFFTCPSCQKASCCFSINMFPKTKFFLEYIEYSLI